MKIKSKQYAQALFELTQGKSQSEIDALVLNFVETLKKNGDFKKSENIVKNFISFYNKENNIVEAEILSARKLSDDQIKMVESFIVKKYSAKEVILNDKVDENVLGGILVKVGDEVTNFSLSSRLNKMKSCLLK